MPVTTTTAPDGHGGTFTSTVRTDGKGNVISRDTVHRDAQGREVDRETETDTYHPNGRRRSRVITRRGPGDRTRVETQDWDANGNTEVIVVDESAGGKAVRHSETHFRRGRMSTGDTVEYDPPGTERRRIHEVYGPDGVLRERTVIEYDDAGRERRRRTDRFDARGRRIGGSDTLLDRASGYELVESRAFGSRESIVRELDRSGVVKSISEKRYDADGSLLSWWYSAPSGRGDRWTSGRLPGPAIEGGKSRRKARG